MKDRWKRPEIRSAFSLLCWEASFALAYETWVGASYLSGLAGELAVPVVWVTLITALPWIGSAGQLFGVRYLVRVKSVKRYVLGVAMAGRSLWLVPLALAAFWGYRSTASGEAFPTQAWFGATALIACLATLLSSSGAVGWMAWIRDLIPGSIHGRFLGTRQRYVMLGLIAANLLGAAWVGWKPRGLYVGYAALGLLAIVAGAISTALLSQVPAPVNRGGPRAEVSATGFRAAWRELLSGTQYGRIVLFGAAFNGAIQLAGPYFPYYYTRDLAIPMSWVAVWATLTNLGCLVAAGTWGRLVDRRGGAIPALWLCCHLISVSPLPYVVRSAEWVKWVAPAEFFVNGLAWSGFQLAVTTLLLRASPAGASAAHFSIYAFLAGLTGAAGSLLGGWLSVALAPWGGFPALWVVASVVRLATTWIFLSRVAQGSPARLAAG